MDYLNLDALCHIKQIEFLKARYCRAIDEKRWNDLPEMFTSNASFQGFGGGIISSASAFVEHISRLLEGSVTVHHLHQHEIAFVGGAEATGVWSMMDYNEWSASGVLRKIPSAKGFRGYGSYEDRYLLVDGVWHIESMRLKRIRVDPIFAP